MDKLLFNATQSLENGSNFHDFFSHFFISFLHHLRKQLENMALLNLVISFAE